MMKFVLSVIVVLFVISGGEARAERASVAIAHAVVRVAVVSAKATCHAAKAVPPAVSKLPTFSWRGLKWIATHI